MSDQLRNSVVAQNTQLLALRGLIDAAVTAGSLTFYSGPLPQIGGGALQPENKRLVQFPLQKPCAAVNNGEFVFAGIFEQMIDTSGRPKFARLADGNGTAIGDLTVGPVDGELIGGVVVYSAIRLADTNLLAGGWLRLHTLKLTVP